MCGITGFNWLDEKLIKEMTNEISHRGPDDEGYFVDNKVSLGHRRLSILDLSKLGHQPMTYSSGNQTLIITYNGEIYNYENQININKKGLHFQNKNRYRSHTCIIC